MNFYIYLPIAGNSINLFLLLGLGGVVGFLSGLFGVGGGFLLTPLLIMIGIPPTVAAASDSIRLLLRRHLEHMLIHVLEQSIIEWGFSFFLAGS